MARRLAIVSLAVHDSPASVCLHYKRATTTWSMHALLSFCNYTSNAAIYELRGNYELFGAHFNGQCMNTLYTISACMHALIICWNEQSSGETSCY